MVNVIVYVSPYQNADIIRRSTTAAEPYLAPEPTANFEPSGDQRTSSAAWSIRSTQRVGIHFFSAELTYINTYGGTH